MRKYFVLGAALMMVAAPALAQDAAIVFAALDADRNGQVTQAEAQKNVLVTQNFAQADTNLDGMLSRAEFEAAFGGRPQAPSGGG
jgi:hypothetical protein